MTMPNDAAGAALNVGPGVSRTLQVLLTGLAAVLFIVGSMVNFATGYGGYGTLMLVVGGVCLAATAVVWNAARRTPTRRVSSDA